MAPALSKPQAADVASVFRALADPVRVQILHRLVSAAPNGVCVCDLQAPLRLTQPRASYHLRVLRDAGLVDRARHGTFAYYSVKPDALERVAAVLVGQAPELAAVVDEQAGADATCSRCASAKG
jgi:ArsR family transcriptional regulator, arsenate/arsenite/antimonite-responsive transcriptional repressor